MLGRVLLVDDHPAVRRTLRALLTEASVGICGEAENGRQAIDKASELQPDVVVLDLVMPKMNGLEAAYEIRQRAPSSKIILLSLHYSPEDGLAFANSNLSELNSDTPAGLVSNTTYNATHCGNLSSRMCNLESDSGGFLDGHVCLHKTPV